MLMRRIEAHGCVNAPLWSMQGPSGLLYAIGMMLKIRHGPHVKPPQTTIASAAGVFMWLQP